MSRPTTGRRGLTSVREGLGERDLAVLRSVHALRLVDARQLEALHFWDHATPLAGARTARRVLERLTTQRLLQRLDRRVGGVRAGSASYIYAVGPVGERLLCPGEPRRRMLEPGERFVRHTLAVAQLAADLTVASRSGGFDLLELTPEPACWRRFTGPAGTAETLKPDLRLTLGDTELEHHWFVEVDLATESRSAVLRKCRQYVAYWRTGREQVGLGLFPRVAWLVPDTRRQAQLRQAIDAGGVEQALFTVERLADAVTVLTAGGVR